MGAKAAPAARERKRIEVSALHRLDPFARNLVDALAGAGIRFGSNEQRQDSHRNFFVIAASDPELEISAIASATILASCRGRHQDEAMAWRVDEAVIRGEIDNRECGRVVGKIWLAGRDKPVELDLQGNCWRDLAGRRLEFSNPNPKPGALDGFAQKQHGVVGDITASRKVKVPEIPLEQIGEYYLARKPFPWHWGNSLYLEWHSERNGRVVIESAEFELKVIGEAAWEMTEAGEEQQRQANGEAMTGFMDRLAKAFEAEANDEDFNTGTEEETDEK